MSNIKNALFDGLKILSCNYYFQRKKKGSLIIVMFHQVNDDNRLFYPGTPVSVFHDLCKFLKLHYEVISLHQIAEHYRHSDRPAAVITFDDGHYDIIKNVLPILSKLELPFNVNIDTQAMQNQKPQDYVKVYDILNQGRLQKYFNETYMMAPIEINYTKPYLTEKAFTALLTKLTVEQRKNLISDLEIKTLGSQSANFSKILSANDLKLLGNKGVEIGSHTHTHSDLTTLTEGEMIFELKESKEILESILKREINILAYPNGKCNEQVRKAAKSVGYEILLETEDCVNVISHSSNLLGLKRVNIYHKTLNESLAHIYGITRKIRSILGKE